ncbi:MULTISPECIES: TlpA family protein disulfide reductase [unclassified Carboxylicivirga]|uniref:TlpA family protein disulfide reductase n=1 Tax=Carboxylicivirga TaxID=1628153 RepID=UPI003D3308C0
MRQTLVERLIGFKEGFSGKILTNNLFASGLLTRNYQSLLRVDAVGTKENYLVIKYSTYMKSVLTTLMISIISLTAFSQTPDDRGYIVKVGQEAPDFEMTLTDGSTLRLSDLRGHVVMLQFTASWCGVCRKEMPHIEKEIWQAYKGKGLKVFGVDRDEPREKALQMIEATGITYPMALDDNADIFGLFADKKSGVTRNVLIDKAGKIIFLTRLFNEDEFKALVKRIGEEVN